MSEAGTIGRILLVTDFSSCARRAEAYAAWMARSWHAHMIVMTVLEFPPEMDPEYCVNEQYLTERMSEASSRLADYKQRAGRQGIEVSTRIATGVPSVEVIAAAQMEECDLIALGTRGKTELAHVLLGSTAERVIRTGPCPVLAVHADPAEETKPPPQAFTLERILVPVDFSDCSLDAVEYAALVARQAGASIELLSVLEPIAFGLDFTLNDPTAYEQDRAQATRRLKDIAGALRAAGVSSTINVRGGMPRDSILVESLTIASDLLVMGTHGRRGISHVMSGSVTEAVLRHAPCPVLTIRSPKFHPDRRRIVPRADTSCAR